MIIKSQDDEFDIELNYADMGLQQYKLVRRNKTCAKLPKKRGSENMKEDTKSTVDGNLRRESNQKLKTKFRASKEWKDFRKELKRRQKIDPISLRPLTPRANIHHLDLRIENYTDISDENKYTALNKSSHDFVHWGYNIAKRIGLKTFRSNFVEIIGQMLIMNGEEDKIYE